MKNFLENLFSRSPASKKTLSYDEEKEIARNKDPKVRAQLAARADAHPEILYFLAEDPSPEVRRQIALNKATPPQAHLLLAKDADEVVRAHLAEKVSSLVPELPADEKDRLVRATHDALEVLARDQATRVRQVLSEALKDVANAPAHVIKRLARDIELVVAGPVLEFSPVLTDEDLLEIIASPSVKGAVTAVSRRTGVPSRVADAIAATDDVEAITALLGNASAQIREETLDSLIDRAEDVVAWHEPLVRRPELPGRAAARIAGFVADTLLHVLSERKDLSPDTLEEVSRVVHKRLSEGAEPKGLDKVITRSGPVDELVDSNLARARRMQIQGTLNDDAIAAALNSNDLKFAAAAVAVRANLDLEVVRKAVFTNSAKGMMALAARAKLPAPLAGQLQIHLAKVDPEEALPFSQGALYPMSQADIDWQIDFLKSQVAESDGAAKPDP